MLVVSGHEVRCREDLNMSIKMCVCVVRDGVQMILPIGSQNTCLQLWVCLKVEPILLSGKWKLSTPLCDEHVP